MTDKEKADWLREHGWLQRATGDWVMPRPTFSPMLLPAAYKLGLLLVQIDEEFPDA